MKIKNINKGVRVALCLAVFLLIAITGCENALETKVFSEITPENFFKTESDFDAALITLYNPFGTDWGSRDAGSGSANLWYNHLYNANNVSYFMRGELSTDELNRYAIGTEENFNWGPSTFGDDGVYAKIRHVARATSVIQSIGNSPLPDQVKQPYIAQAKVLRAWMMYVLYDFFGPVNAKFDPATLTNTNPEPRPSEAVYTAQIETDLTEALPSLADMHNDDPSKWGRVSKGVARMLLLKLYMHTKQWAKAEAIGKEIIGMGYVLQPNYADIFKAERNKEIIFAIDCSISEGARNWYPQHVFPTNPAYVSSPIITRGGGWTVYVMPWEFYDKFGSGDKRTSTLITSYLTTGSQVVDRSNLNMRGAIPLKYTGITGDRTAYPDDFVIFRLGEVYLSVAEAINELRGPADAYTYVNEVRARAGVSNFSGMNQGTFRDAILDERGRELFAEGARRQDLIRHGKYIENAQNRGHDANNYQVVYPIPSTIILESNNVVSQNDGYIE